MIIWFSSFLMTTPLATKKSVFTRQLARASRSALWTGVSSIQKESGKYHNSGGFQHHAENRLLRLPAAALPREKNNIDCESQGSLSLKQSTPAYLFAAHIINSDCLP